MAGVCFCCNGSRMRHTGHSSERIGRWAERSGKSCQPAFRQGAPARRGTPADRVVIPPIGATRTPPAPFCHDGRAGQVFRIQTVSQALRVAVTVALAVIGIEAVALGLAAVALVQAGLILMALRAATGVRLRDLAGVALSSAAVTAAAAAGPLAVALLDPGARLGVLPDLALGGGLSAIGWAWALVATGHPLAGELRDLLASARRPYPLRASRQ